LTNPHKSYGRQGDFGCFSQKLLESPELVLRNRKKLYTKSLRKQNLFGEYIGKLFILHTSTTSSAKTNRIYYRTWI